jgi:hypothetical protein
LDDFLRRIPRLFRRDRGLEITQIVPDDRTMLRPDRNGLSQPSDPE